MSFYLLWYEYLRTETAVTGHTDRRAFRFVAAEKSIFHAEVQKRRGRGGKRTYLKKCDQPYNDEHNKRDYADRYRSVYASA